MAKRLTMMDQLEKILPVFPPSADKKVERPESYIVLKFEYSEPSRLNSLGSFSYWKVQIYVSPNTITTIDRYSNEVRQLLKANSYELTYADNGDYYDNMLQRYRMEIQYRIPRGENV